MRAVPAVVHRLLGLLHPEWGLHLGASGQARRRRGAQGVVLEEVCDPGPVQGGVPVEGAIRCSYDGARLERPHLVGRCELSSLRGAILVAPQLGPGARILGCDLSEVQWSGGAGPEAELVCCALPGATLTDLDLGALQLCDLTRARLVRVHLARAVGCDFSDAHLVDCDLAGADLRGSRFRGATFAAGSLRGARVDGADFGGARGLDAAARRRLLADGAWFGGPRVTRLARRLPDRGSPLATLRLAQVLSLGAVLVGLGGAAAGLWIALKPPPTASASAPPPSGDRIPTEEERNRTRIALGDLRTALKAAHETMADNGATHRSWPTIVEFQHNHYDLDGDGDGEVMARLFVGGLPGNFLTDSEGGVLPYCNEEPTQDTISGVDTDWHYCEQTGRVFASAGFSGQATLNW